MNAFIGNVIEKSLDNVREGDYTERSLLMCSECAEPKQMKKVILGKEQVVGIPCRCERERQAADEARRKQEAAQNRRIDAFGSKRTKRFDYTFANDDGKNTELTRQLTEYCNDFQKYRAKGVGVLLYSPSNGSGKTFMACAVANRLIDYGYRVLVTDMAKIRDRLFDDKNVYLDELCGYALIVIDDIGAESGSDYMLEAEYRVINELTENCVPLILTTNYTPKELSESENRTKKRIYDRIIGSCIPLKVEQPDGRSRRLTNCQRILEEFKKG